MPLPSLLLLPRENVNTEEKQNSKLLKNVGISWKYSKIRLRAVSCVPLKMEAKGITLVPREWRVTRSQVTRVSVEKLLWFHKYSARCTHWSTSRGWRSHVTKLPIIFWPTSSLLAKKKKRTLLALYWVVRTGTHLILCSPAISSLLTWDQAQF